MKKSKIFILFFLALLFTINFNNYPAVVAVEILVDSDFSTATDSADLRTNGSGQDWYESRADSSPNGPNQLTLDETDVAGNATKKAKFTGSSSYNTYLSQAFPSGLTSGTFTAQWDIYVDSITDSTNDNSAYMFIGDDSGGTQGPHSTNNERWMYMAFHKSGGGTTGNVDLVYRTAANVNQAALDVASSTLLFDQWYTIKVVGNLTTDTYDIYVDDMLQVSGATARYAAATPSYIGFATWNDGPATFYVDNVTLDDGTGTANLTQNNYRWYANTDDITPTDPWPAGGTDTAENTAVSSANAPADEAVLRLRMTLQDADTQLNAGAQDFKLQYGTGASCASVSNWADVGSASASTAWRGYLNGSVADGATISSLVLTGSDVGGSYEEENNSVANPNAVAVGQDVEYDWVLQAHDLLSDANYCFRMVKADGTTLSAYTRYPTISVANTTFNVSFEGGNGENFVRNGDAVSFDGELDIGTGTYLRTTWFYFSMNNVNGKTIAFTMNNATGANTETNVWTGKRPFYSYDQENWYPVTNDGTHSSPSYTWNAPGNAETFTQDTVYIAYNPPYTYTDALDDITRWEASTFASSTEVIGQSVQSRDMHLLTFENVTSSIPYANKKVMWVGSRQHPMEVCGSWSAQGVVDFYIDQNDPEAKVFQDGWILKMVPDDNPDGMYLGQTRSNANGWDLNREWNNGAPNIDTEEIEVYNIHSAIHDWVTTQGNSIDIFLDMHSQSSASPSAFYANTSFSHEIMEDNLGFLANQPFNAFSAGSYAIDVVYDQYGAPAYTVEGPDVRWDANNHPTAANCRAWGRAWAKAAISEFETNAKVFSFHEELEGSGSSDNLLVTAPGKFRAVFDEAKGGAMTYWYDIENQSDHTAQLGDTTNGIDRLEWNDGTNRVLADSTSVATSSVYLAGPVISKITYSGNFDGQANYPYTLTKTIWEDGRIWNTFSLTNNTGATVDWSDISLYNSLTNTNFTRDRDNDDDTPTPGTDNWWSQIGNGTGGIKATLTQYFADQTGGWVYDAYASAGGPPGTTYYRDSDGPSQANGETITIHYVTQISPDNDLAGNEAQIDVWRNDIANPDDPTMTLGTFTGFATSTGSLSFTLVNNQVAFTYTNADTYTKKKPTFVLNSYTANTAPVLKVNGSFLDSESGAAHATSTHISASYTSFVDTDNDTAYVQYLSDISTNVPLQLGASLPTALPDDVTNVSATYNNDTQITVSWTDNSDDESGFKIYRRDDTGSGWGSYTQIGTAVANAVSFVDNSTNNAGNPPAANEKYQYQVLSYNLVGNGNAVTDSGSIITTPAAPTIDVPTVNSSTSITWTWTDNANFEDSYRVDYVTGSASATDADGLSADSESWTDADLTPNTQYAVEVHAYQTNRGESAASANSTAVYTLANIPTSLSLTANSGTQITASWNANSNPGSTEYYVENVTASTNSGWITSTSWASTSLTCNTSYSFKVKSRNANNTETSYTAEESITTAACGNNNNNSNNNSGGSSQPAVSEGQGNLGSANGNVISQNISENNDAQAYFPALNTGGDSIQVRLFAQDSLNHQLSPLPASHGFSGAGLEVEVLRNNQPVTSLGVPVTLTFTYTDEQINSLSLKENTLRIYRWDEDSNAWVILTNHNIDLANNRISGQTNHFSLFALLGQQGPVIPQAKQQLIKLANDPKVYVITGNYKRHLPTEEIFLSYRYNWQDIETVAANTFNLYPTSNLIKLANNPRVYKLENNNKRWIPNEQTFNALQLNWSAIMTVNQTEFNFYGSGTDLSTNNSGKYQFTNFLSLGSVGDEVRALQNKLKELGYFNHPTSTGYFGPVTETAVKAFQQANNLPVVGYVGPQTRAILNQ